MKSAHAVSAQSDSHLATKEAVDNCLAKLGDRSELMAAMAFIGADHNPEQVAVSLRELLPGIPTLGCTTDGEISGHGLSVDSVSVMVLSSKNIRAKASVITGLGEGSLEAGQRIARELGDESAKALILLPDGLTGNGSAIIRGALEVLGRQFIIAGGTAGDRGKFVKTWQFCNGEAHTDALVGLMFYSDKPIEVGFGVMSGWKPMGVAKEVTQAEGNTVYKIENESALDVYATFLGDKANQLPAIGVEYPFALVDESGLVDERGIRDGEEYILLRAPMSVDQASGAVSFAAEIPQGSRIKMTRAKSNDIVEASREAAQRTMNRMQGKPDAVFFFSCMARKVVLGRKTNREIEVAKEVFGEDVPMIGFYTYGEIANCGDKLPVCRFHNETATFLAIREG